MFDIIMHISSFRDGVTSSIETKTSAFISSELISFDLAAEPMPTTNSAPGPQTVSSELDGTSTVAYVPYAQTMCVDDNSCGILAKLMGLTVTPLIRFSFTAPPKSFLPLL